MIEFVRVPGIVIGNGLSRREIDLGALRYSVAELFGCNAIYRDMAWVDWVGCVDPSITEELLVDEPAIFPRNRVLYQYRYNETETIERPDSVRTRKARAFACGPMMLSFAADLGRDPIYLVGFDFTPATLYAGTPGYDPAPERDQSEDVQVDQIQQVLRIVAEHGDRRFVLVDCAVHAELSPAQKAELQEHGVAAYSALERITWTDMLVELGG